MPLAWNKDSPDAAQHFGPNVSITKNSIETTDLKIMDYICSINFEKMVLYSSP